MGDFLDQQMALIEEAQPENVDEFKLVSSKKNKRKYFFLL